MAKKKTHVWPLHLLFGQRKSQTRQKNYPQKNRKKMKKQKKFPEKSPDKIL